MHALLKRQLKRLGLSEDSMPTDPGVWAALLERIDATYAQVDQDRYTLERSMDMSSSEMQRLYQELERSSRSQLAIERDKLQRSATLLETMVDAAPDGILVIDGNLEIVNFNRRYCEMWGIDAELARSIPAEELRRRIAALAADPDHFIAQIRAAYASGDDVSRGEFVLADGRIFEYCRRSVTMPGGGALGHVWFLGDVTHARRAEQELREAKEAAESASKAKSGFLSNMSHEMRTPLNAILGFARVMSANKDGSLSERNQTHIKYILSASTHMLTLVNDLLDFRRLEEGRDAIAITRLELGPIVDAAIEMVRALADEKHHAVSVAIAQSLPHALADRRAVLQILVNLLSNAVKFTPARGEIEISARADEHALVVAVRDTGAGIHPDDQPKLFTYYEQLGAKHEHHMQGSGIGLALTRALVEKLGGHIAVDSTPGVGSTFEFSIPRWREAA